MFGLGKKLKGFLRVWNRAEHAPLAKASCAAGVLMANASGGISEEEIAALKTAMQNKPNLVNFRDDIPQWIDERALTLSTSAYTGRLQLMRELEAVNGDKEHALEVLAVSMDVAAADGHIDGEEETMANAIASKLGVRLSDLG